MPNNLSFNKKKKYKLNKYRPIKNKIKINKFM